MHKFTKSALVHYLLPCTKTAGKVKLVTYCVKKPKSLLLIYNIYLIIQMVHYTLSWRNKKKTNLAVVSECP